MISVAVVGPDGAGKTTVAQKLLQTAGLPVRYLYMGINIESSNVALPTSRLIEALKRWRRKRSGRAEAASTSLHLRTNGRSNPAGKLWAGVRLLNRLAEEWYRQLLSWRYRRQGNIVIYDRHFKFDFEHEQTSGSAPARRLTDRLHRWLLAHLYPSPDLVIYLDAPAEVLFARKGEASVAYLESRRQAFLRQGRRLRNFHVVDARQPFEAVYAQVLQLVTDYYHAKCPPARGLRAPAIDLADRP